MLSKLAFLVIDIVILLTDLAPAWSISLHDREDNSAVIAKVPASKPIAGNMNGIMDMCIWFKIATFDGGSMLIYLLPDFSIL